MRLVSGFSNAHAEITPDDNFQKANMLTLPEHLQATHSLFCQCCTKYNAVAECIQAPPEILSYARTCLTKLTFIIVCMRAPRMNEPDGCTAPLSENLISAAALEIDSTRTSVKQRPAHDSGEIVWMRARARLRRV